MKTMTSRQETQEGDGENDWPGIGDMMRPVKSGEYLLSGPVGSTQEDIEAFIEGLLMPN